MPQMMDITVKKADGTTDIVYTALSPSAGDTVPAQWSPTTESVPDFRPRLSLSTRWNGPRSARVARIHLNYPITQVVAGVSQVAARVPVEVNLTLPTNVSAAEVDEAIYQAGNLLVSTLIRSSLSAGFAPT